jgi:hypothetical protein
MATIRHYARRLKDGEPGRRFLDLYEFRKKDPPAPAARAGLWLMALLLIGGGAAIGWLPGPGGFIAIFGLAIVAMEFRFMAVTLDYLERLGREAWARLRGKKTKKTKRSPLPAGNRPR